MLFPLGGIFKLGPKSLEYHLCKINEVAKAIEGKDISFGRFLDGSFGVLIDIPLIAFAAEEW